LPLEMQSIVCNHLFGRVADDIPQRKSEAAFRWLASPNGWGVAGGKESISYFHELQAAELLAEQERVRSITPQLGTTATVLEFSRSDADRQREVIFSNNELNIQLTVTLGPSKTSLTVPEPPGLEQKTHATFSVSIPGVNHPPLEFTWWKPRYFPAVCLLHRELPGTTVDQANRWRIGTGFNSLPYERKVNVLLALAHLGQHKVLASLRTEGAYDIAAASPSTRKTILHVGLEEGWPQVVELAAQYLHLFLIKDDSGVTPIDLLRSLPNGNDCKRIGLGALRSLSSLVDLQGLEE